MKNPLEYLIPKPVKVNQSYIWGTIKSTGTYGSNITIQLDGETESLAGTPSLLVDPLSLAVGDRVYMVRDRKKLVVLGSNYSNQQPAGSIVMMGGSVVPAGWLRCQGQALSKAQLPRLFAAIGYTWGGSGDTFNAPNFMGRGPMGYTTSETEFNTIGKTGGAKTHTLTTAQMPAHSHSGTAASAGSHSHSAPSGQMFLGGLTGGIGRGGTAVGSGRYYFGSANINDLTYPSIQSGGAHSHSVSTNNTGGGGSHNNLQPYVTVPFIIKL